MDNQNDPTQNTGNITDGGVIIRATQDMILPGVIKPRHLVASPQNPGDLYYSDGTNFQRFGGTPVQGSLAYYTGTVWTMLGVGTNGQFLQTQGANANPQWATVVSSASKLIQTVSTTYATQTSTTSASLVDTGLTLNITPTSASSKIMIYVTQAYIVDQQETGATVSLIRAGSTIYTPVINLGYASGIANNRVMLSLIYEDSPATTSATTYKIQMLRANGAGTIFAQGDASTSSIVLQEITA